MAIPDECFSKNLEKSDNSIYESHTTCGAAIVGLNTLPACQYFVQVCGDICMHHHERFDGKGFPHGIKGKDISIYVQLCRIIIDFDNMFIKNGDKTPKEFDFIINDLRADSGIYGPELINFFTSCKASIITYYRKKMNRQLV